LTLSGWRGFYSEDREFRASGLDVVDSR